VFCSSLTELRLDGFESYTILLSPTIKNSKTQIAD